MDFNFVDEDKTETVAGMTKLTEDETFKLEPPSAFIKTAHYLPESISPGKTETTTKKLLTKFSRSSKIESAARVPFLGKLQEEEREVHHRDHESRLWHGQSCFYGGGLDSCEVLLDAGNP